jgi:hypothetical protein
MVASLKSLNKRALRGFSATSRSRAERTPAALIRRGRYRMTSCFRLLHDLVVFSAFNSRCRGDTGASGLRLLDDQVQQFNSTDMRRKTVDQRFQLNKR